MKVLVTVIALSLLLGLNLQFSPIQEDPDDLVRIQRRSDPKEPDPNSFIRLLGKRQVGGFAGRIRLLKVDESGKSFVLTKEEERKPSLV